jgi:hypothetical protein
VYLLRVVDVENPPEYPRANIPLVELPAAEPAPEIALAEATPDAVEVHDE